MKVHACSIAILAFLGCLSPAQAIIPLVDAGICEALLQYVNPACANAGLGPLRCAKEMDWAAQYHTNDMVSMGKLTHDGSDGANLGDRIWASADVMGCGKGRVAENVNAAFAPGGAKAHFDAWMNSPGHRQNILLPDITHMGMAVADAGKGEQYATQVFHGCRS